MRFHQDGGVGSSVLKEAVHPKVRNTGQSVYFLPGTNEQVSQAGPVCTEQLTGDLMDVAFVSRLDRDSIQV